MTICENCFMNNEVCIDVISNVIIHGLGLKKEIQHHCNNCGLDWYTYF